MKRKESDKWHVTLDVGRAIWYGGEHICPDPDLTGARTYFSVPNYGLDAATSDVVNAEMAYKDKIRTFRTEDVALMKEAITDPKKMVVRMHDLRRMTAQLSKENTELLEQLARDESLKSDMVTQTSKLQKGVERMTQRLEQNCQEEQGQDEGQ